MAHGRQTRASVGIIVLTVMVCFVGLGSIGQYSFTPQGVQCPTAPVQTILAAKLCCGSVVGYEQRAPKPGEAGFLQCRCSEKRAPARLVAAAPKVQVFLVAEAENVDPGTRLDPVAAGDDSFRPAFPVSGTDFFHPPALV